MNCKYFIYDTAFLLGIFGNCTAQNDISLSGVVVIQNSKYATGKTEYVVGASIRSIASTPTTSDSKGEFTLVFSDRPPGDVARIIVARQGYELVNTKELEAASVIGRLSPLQAVMCKQGLLDENRMIYYNVSDHFIKEKYNSRLKMLLQKKGEQYNRVVDSLQSEMSRQIKSNEDALALLDEQRKAFEKQSQELSEKFAITNLDDKSLSYQRAFKAFGQGSIDQAIAILDSVDLEKRLTENINKKQKTDSAIGKLLAQKGLAEIQIKQDIDQCIFKARMYKIRFQFSEAMKNYELAIRSDTTNYANMDEFAYLLLQLRQYDRAIELYSRLLNELRVLAVNDPAIYEPAIANYLDDLSSLYEEKNDFKKATDFSEESLEIRRRFDDKKNFIIRYKSELALTLNNRGTLYFKNNDFDNAEQALSESLEIRRQLSEVDSVYTEPDLAVSLHNMGLLYFSRRDYKKSEVFHLEALKIRRRLAYNNPLLYDQDLAQSLENTGLLYTRKKDGFKQAEGFLRESLDIYSRLAEKNPYTYEAFKAEVLGNWGKLCEDNKDFERALTLYLQSSSIYTTLSENVPQVYEPTLSKIFNNIGNIYSQINDSSTAIEFYRESLKIAIHLARQNAQAYEPALAQILKNLGRFYHDRRDFVNAADLYLQSLEIYTRLAKADPQTFESLQALVLDYLGTLYANKSDPKTGEKFWKECAEIRLRLYDKYHDEYKNSLVRALDAYCTALYLQGKFFELEKISQIGIKVDDTYPFFKQDLATALLFQGRFEDAKKEFLLIKDLSDDKGHFLKKGILIDLDVLEKKGFTHPDVPKIRELLME